MHKLNKKQLLALRKAGLAMLSEAPREELVRAIQRIISAFPMPANQLISSEELHDAMIKREFNLIEMR